MTEEPRKKKRKVNPGNQGDYEIFVRSEGLHHIAGNIFVRLDLQSLLMCQIVCKSWNQFIKEEKSLWLPHLRQLKDGEMINHFRVDMNLYEWKKFKCVSKKQNERFLSIFPQWEEIIDHFEAEHPIFIKKFLKNMVKYLKMDWNIMKKKLSKVYHKEGFDKLPNVFEPYCPLYYAIDNADIEFIDTILPTKVMFNNHKMLRRMVEQKLNRSLKLIIQKKFLPIRDMQNLIWDSCSFKNLEMLKYMIIDFKAIKIFHEDIWDKGLWYAAKNGHADVVSFLLHSRYGKMLTQNNGPRCFHDVFYDDDDEDVSENLALHIACENGHFDVVKLLLDYLSENPGATHINLKNDDDGYTPLMIACEKKETEIVKLLLEQDDLEVNLQDNAGKTAFYHACLNLSSECAKLLLQHPSIEIKSSRERLPLHGFALEWDDAFGINPLSEWTKMFEFLCSLPNIDINDQDARG